MKDLRDLRFRREATGWFSNFSVLVYSMKSSSVSISDDEWYSSVNRSSSALHGCENNYFAEMWSSSEEGSYLRPIHFCITQL